MFINIILKKKTRSRYVPTRLNFDLYVSKYSEKYPDLIYEIKNMYVIIQKSKNSKNYSDTFFNFISTVNYKKKNVIRF